jgi:hypothetical protein
MLFMALSKGTREGIPMTAQGLLVKGTNGEDYLLTTEPNRGMPTHRLVVVRKVNDDWKRVEGDQQSACREALIGAFIDFFVDLCRVLNSSDRQEVSEAVPIQRASLDRLQTVETGLLHQSRKS